MRVSSSENPYLHTARIKAALSALNLRPTRGMGQNFLLDADALGAIVAAATLSSSDYVLEVGPGLGVLTWELLRQAAAVTSVELDKRLAARLHEEFAGNQKLQIIQHDILSLDLQAALADWPADVNYKVVANLPYAITSPVLRYFLEAQHKPTLMVVLVQLEVARRITASAGDMSVLAHAVQIYARPEIVSVVPATSFYPVPAVDSAILRLYPNTQPLEGIESPEHLMRLIKAGFLHARKTLANALPSGLAAMGQPVAREQLLGALQASGIDPQRRAETLSLAEWVALWKRLESR